MQPVLFRLIPELLADAPTGIRRKRAVRSVLQVGSCRKFLPPNYSSERQDWVNSKRPIIEPKLADW